jgi:hypothetical protein
MTERNKVKPIRSYTAGVVPDATEIETNELAVSWVSPGKLFTKNAAGDVITLDLGSLPAQADSFGPLVTDGTSATWTSRYSIVSPVLVQGAGMSFTRDTAAGEITIAFAGGTSGLAVGSLTPLALGVAAAGSSGNASREDHVHQLPTVGDITAAAAIHTHDAAAIASGTIDAARLPVTVSSLNALTGGITIAGGANVTVSTASSTITIAAAGGVSFGLFLALS